MRTLGVTARRVKEALRRRCFREFRERLRRGARLSLFADFPADAILLPVQRSLLGLGDMSAVPARHRVLFLADAMVLAMQLRGLGARQLAFLHFLVNATILVLEAVVHL